MRRNVSILLAIVALVLGACGSDAPSVDPLASHGSTPSSSGQAVQPSAGTSDLASARIGLNGPVSNLDPMKPMLIPDVQAAVLTAGQFFRFDADGNPQPDLIESSSTSPDGLTYTMKMRPNMTFSDGSPITADDMIYAFERVRSAPPVNGYLVQNLESVSSTDPATIVWTFSKPQPDFLYFFGYQWVLVHPKAKVESDPEYFTHPVSSGPYTLTSGAAGSSTLVLDANPNYVNGPVAITKLELVAVPDLTARSLQLAQGGLDFAHDLPPSVLSGGDVIAPGVRAFPHSSGGNFALVINKRLPADNPLSNVDVRRAISLAVNRDQVSQQAFFGISAPVNGFLWPGAPEGVSTLPNDGKQDLAAARDLLATTPFKDGFEFKLVAWADRPGWQDAALVVRQNLAEIGITANIDAVQATTASARLASGDYDVQFTGLTSGQPALLFLNQLFAPGGSWAKYRAYDNPSMTDLFNQAAVELDPAKRLKDIQDIQVLGAEDLSYIPITERVELDGSRVPAEALIVAAGKNFLVVGSATK